MPSFQLVKFCICSLFLLNNFCIISSKIIFILANENIINETQEFQEINIGIESLLPNEDNAIWFNETNYIQNSSCAIDGLKINIK